MENTLITGDRLEAIIRLAGTVPEGTFAEVGVYKGGSIATLATAFPNRTVIGFDTFEGLPKEHWKESEIHQPGDFEDTSIGAVYEFVCVEQNCSNVYFIKGLFPNCVKGKDIENIQFAFVHIDVDFYLAIKKTLSWFWKRMVKGGIIVFDDYGWPKCPGVKQALDEFKRAKPIMTANYQAAIIKR